MKYECMLEVTLLCVNLVWKTLKTPVLHTLCVLFALCPEETLLVGMFVVSIV